MVAAIVVALISPPEGLAQNAWYFFAIFIAVVLGLILESLSPDSDRIADVARRLKGASNR